MAPQILPSIILGCQVECSWWCCKCAIVSSAQKRNQSRLLCKLPMQPCGQHVGSTYDITTWHCSGAASQPGSISSEMYFFKLHLEPGAAGLDVALHVSQELDASGVWPRRPPRRAARRADLAPLQPLWRHQALRLECTMAVVGRVVAVNLSRSTGPRPVASAKTCKASNHSAARCSAHHSNACQWRHRRQRRRCRCRVPGTAAHLVKRLRCCVWSQICDACFARLLELEKLLLQLFSLLCGGICTLLLLLRIPVGSMADSIAWSLFENLC